MIRIDIDDTQAKVLLNELAGGGIVTRAWRRATKKTADWVASQLAKIMSARTGIPQRIFRSRRIRQRATGDGRIVWFGTLPIPAGHIGRLRQLEGGAMAGEYYFEGGFMARMPTGHVSIYKRRGRKRLPIVEQAVALPMAEGEARTVATGARAELEKKTLQELHYELRVRGK